MHGDMIGSRPHSASAIDLLSSSERRCAMKVLVAFDGTEHSVLALEEGAKIAASEGAELTVLSVVQPDAGPSKSGGHAGLPPHADEDIAFAHTYLSERGIEASTKVSHGDPAEEIVEEARVGDFDLIVVGTRELGPVGRVLGSVSRKVAKASSSPVVVAGKTGTKRIEPVAAAR
jgi:nucleotide-binding universal stress UspA family protein